MWPFKKKRVKQAVPFMLTDEEQKLVPVNFTLSKEEHQEVQSFFETMKSMGPPGHTLYVAPEVKDSWIAMALHHRADSLARMIRSNAYAPGEPREVIVEKMLSAAYKAFAIFQAPIYAFDIACALDVAGESAEARRMFFEFLRLQASFTPGAVGESATLQRDVTAAVGYANARIAA